MTCGLTSCDTNLDLGGGQSIDMVLIPAGSDPQGRYDLTNDFYLMTTEVTQGMFYQIMGYQAWNGYSASYGVGNDYPAYYVNWHMVADFANMVTQQHNSVNGTSLQECYSCSSSGNIGHLYGGSESLSVQWICLADQRQSGNMRQEVARSMTFGHPMVVEMPRQMLATERKPFKMV